MKINHMRMDDRMIHGQIVTAWIKESQADTILLADDKAAGDPTQQMILKFAVPAGIKLIIVTMKEAYQIICDDSKKGNALLIVRNPKTAYELFDMGFRIDAINVGNISNSKSQTGRTRLLSNIYVEQTDVEYLRKIHDLGIRLDVRAVPTDKSIDGMELISKM